MKPLFFKSSSEFREWLVWNGQTATELLAGFYKRDSGKGGITYPEALDEALCFGWIDGIRKSLGEVSYAIRFTPRKSKSNWSLVNVKRAGQLKKLGRMQPPGLKAFQGCDRMKSGNHACERKRAELDELSKRKFQSNKRAWSFFQTQAPWYRRTASWWIMSAKQDETRYRRLAALIVDSENQRRLAVLTPKSRSKSG